MYAWISERSRWALGLSRTFISRRSASKTLPFLPRKRTHRDSVEPALLLPPHVPRRSSHKRRSSAPRSRARIRRALAGLARARRRLGQAVVSVAEQEQQELAEYA